MTPALWLLALACRPEPADRFFVRRDAADLPVWVQGDLEAETFIVVQHGAGASGFIYDWMFDALEAEHALVYWDQRGAGLSQGNAAEETLNLETSVQDLTLVLDVVQERYDPTRQVLLGHSLGGGLSLAYLRDPSRAEGIDGYIDVSGGRTLPGAYDIVREEMIMLSQTLSMDERRSASERAQWAERVTFYEARPDFPRQEPARSTHGEHVEAALLEQGYDQAASTAEMQTFLTQQGALETLLGSFDAFAFGANTARFNQRFDIDGVDMSAEDVSTVTVPALVLAGQFDYAIPVEISEGTFAAFAEAIPPSRIVILESSGHFPMWDQPDAFSAAVLSFLDALPINP